jgi:DNA replication protein DnaC
MWQWVDFPFGITLSGHPKPANENTAAEELLEIVMRRYERTSTLVTSNRQVEDWGKLLGDSAAVTAMLDRLLHHGHILKCGPRSWRTKLPAEQ